MASPQKENGHLDLANEIVDQLAQTQLSGHESRLLWVIWRKTYCWHKKQDWISYSQFRELTKIGNDSHVSRGLKKLIARRIVTKIGKKYSFNKDYDKWEKLPKLVSGVTKIGKKKLPKLADTKENYKRNYTLEARDYFYLKYKEKTGKDFLPSYEKDGAIFKKMLETHPLPQIKELIDKFFISKIPFIIEAGYTIEIFVSQINKLNYQPKKQITGGAEANILNAK